MEAKKKTLSCFLELELAPIYFDRKFLNKACAFARQLYNATMSAAIKSLRRMRNTRAFTKAWKKPRQEWYNDMCQLLKEFHLTENDLERTACNFRNALQKSLHENYFELGASEVRNISSRVWQAIHPFLFKRAKEPHCKSARQVINCISGKDYRDIRVNLPDFERYERELIQYLQNKQDPAKAATLTKPSPPCVKWRRHAIPIKYDPTPRNKAMIYKSPELAEAAPWNSATNQAQSDRFKRVKFSRVVRKLIRGKEHWFVQICLEGTAPAMHPTASIDQVMGIDPGPSSFACFHAEEPSSDDQAVVSKVETPADITKVASVVDASVKNAKAVPVADASAKSAEAATVVADSAKNAEVASVANTSSAKGFKFTPIIATITDSNEIRSIQRKMSRSRRAAHFKSSR